MAKNTKETKNIQNSTIERLDRTACRLLSQKVENQLEALGKELGIKFTYKGGRFSDSNMTMKIEAALIQNGEAKSVEIEDFKTYAEIYGLKPDDLGKEITIGNNKYTIKGLKPRSKKYPIIGEKGDGRRFKLPLTAVKTALGRELSDFEKFYS